MQESENSDFISVSEEESGQRLDVILARRYQEVKSRTYFQYLIDNGFVLVNGQPIKKSLKPAFEDEIEVHFQLTPEIKVAPEPIPLNIIFEDEYLLVINKPAGMVVHPAAGNWSGTVVNALAYHCQGILDRFTEPNESLRPGIVHRLDKDTSGLLIAAKQTLVQQRLVSQFAQKKYIKCTTPFAWAPHLRGKSGR